VAVALQGSTARSVCWRGHAPTPNSSLHPKACSGLHPLPRAAELKRLASRTTPRHLVMRSLGILLVLVAAVGAVCAQNGDALIGIDHVPLAVRDIDQASETFKQLGFAVKPGRPHDNGVRNNHIKFLDGSGLELITATRRTDELSAFYIDHLRRGDGPAFVSFHARNTAKLIAALSAAQIAFSQAGSILTFKDPQLNFVFVVADNRSPTDRPEHFAHSNGAFAISEVWIATDDSAPLQRLLAALGATAKTTVAGTPEPTEALAFEIQNGRVVIVPARHQIVAGRPVIGVVMSVRALAGQHSASIPRAASTPGTASTSTTPMRITSPKSAHGLWLELLRER
jgi:hypothetical protein